jgi:broad specificity phosphatase PhoE
MNTVTPEITTYYLIRHAEKDRSNPQNEDPNLTEEGVARAARWAHFFRSVSFDEVYATEYRRTQQTAAPAALQSNVKVMPYHPNALYSEDFRNRTTGKTVLVVGHSNTTPQFANAILGEERFSNTDDADNGSLYIVTVCGGAASANILHLD